MDSVGEGAVVPVGGQLRSGRRLVSFGLRCLRDKLLLLAALTKLEDWYSAVRLGAAAHPRFHACLGTKVATRATHLSRLSSKSVPPLDTHMLRCIVQGIGTYESDELAPLCIAADCWVAGSRRDSASCDDRDGQLHI